MNHRCISAALILCLICACTMSFAHEQWPRFRGAEGAGLSSQTGLPIKWDASSVVWKTALKGRGQSSPVYWDDRIFLTSALEDGKQRLVFCIDAKDGKMLWEQSAWTGTPEPSHERNGWASASCCTDGKFVYASFGKAGLHCHTVDGKHVWSRELGEFLSETKRGTAASPILAGDMLWKQRLGGAISASPFAADGHAYLLFENRETLVFDPGSSFKELARNTLGALDERKGRLLRPHERKRLGC